MIDMGDKGMEYHESFESKLADINHKILILELDAETSDEDAETLAPIKEAFDQFWRENYEQKDMVFYRGSRIEDH